MTTKMLYTFKWFRTEENSSEKVCDRSPVSFVFKVSVNQRLSSCVIHFSVSAPGCISVPMGEIQRLESRVAHHQCFTEIGSANGRAERCHYVISSVSERDTSNQRERVNCWCCTTSTFNESEEWNSLGGSQYLKTNISSFFGVSKRKHRRDRGGRE